MKNYLLTNCTLAIMGVLFYGCGSSYRVSDDLISCPQMFFKDTSVLHTPKEVEPSRLAHSIGFLTADATIKNKVYTEWKLLHMNNVYIEPPIITKDLYNYLVDSLQMSPNSVNYHYRDSLNDIMYCLIFYVRADYYNNHFRIQADLVHDELRSQSPIYRPGHKYEYYKMLVEVPSEFYIDNIRKGTLVSNYLNTKIIIK